MQYIRQAATPVNEIQVITIEHATGGQFFLELDTTSQGGSLQYSGYIAYDACASPNDGSCSNYALGSDVQTIISSMWNIVGGSVTVVRAQSASNTYVYSVTFPLAMGNVPEMIMHPSQLTASSGTASAEVTTSVDGNVIGGTFRLGFVGETTVDLAHDAAEYDVRVALEALPSIGAVEVNRSPVNYQGGYSWTVQFVSPMNSGNVPSLVPDFSGLTVSSKGASVNMAVTSADGNQIGGSFKMMFKYASSAAIAYNASASAFQTALESMPNNVIPPGTIAVSRTGPDGQQGFSWTVSFLSDYNRTFFGNVPSFNFIHPGLTGKNATADVNVVQQGTIQEVQDIVVSATAAFNSSSTLARGNYFTLSYRGQITQPIPLKPSTSTCNSARTEVQTVATSTRDTTTSGGDDGVSMYLQFQLRYGSDVTAWIQANPSGDGNCQSTARAIASQLETFSVFNDVVVTAQSRNASLFGYQACLWTINFVSSIGNINQLQVQAQNPVSRSTGSWGSASVASDDTVNIATVQNGEKDNIQAALELLPNIGTVTVRPLGSPGSFGECRWRVTFDSNAGNLPLMNVAIDGANPSSPGAKVKTGGGAGLVAVTVSAVTDGTSAPISGNFALTFRGARSLYIPYNADARTVQNALQNLDTIGAVSVVRSSLDENNGATWTVTFLTELGNLDFLEFDNADMTGTVVTGVISKFASGVSPPFNSLDPLNGLPLGSVVVTDLSNLAVTVTGLDAGIAYYFRVAAVNSYDQGPYAFSSTPYAIPQSQRPGPPVNATLNVVDGTSMQVAFSPPILDGGEDVTFYKVEYANQAFASEVQKVDVLCSITNEVQVIKTTTSHSFPEIQLIYINTSATSATQVFEQQTVACEASGGTFRLSFAGYTTQPISYQANAATITTILQQIEIISSVTVALSNPNGYACAARSAPFTVTFNSVVGMSGDLPLMTAYTNSLNGNRFISVTEQTKGSAPIGGTFRLSFRGFATQDVSANIANPVSAQNQLATALGNLDSVPYSGVQVTVYSVNQFSQLWAVTFVAPELGGNVDPLQVVTYFNGLTGSDVQITVFTDGDALPPAITSGTISPTPSSPVNSRAGNQLSGYFTLSYRGHTTDEIDFNAANTVMKARLEALPNIGTVNVVRTGPSVYQEYSWSITFMAMPGAYPFGTGDFLPLVTSSTAASSNVVTLNGISSAVTSTSTQVGTPSLSGTFSLTVTTISGGNQLTQIASGIPADASASEVQSALNLLPTLGTVTVSRTAVTNGYSWLVTFDGCKIVNGTDVCNEGALNLMQLTQTALSPSCQSGQVKEIVRGSGPAPKCQANQPCIDFVTDLSGNAPYNYFMTSLYPGMSYYVRVAAHNSMGFGYPSITAPEFQVPTFNPPGAPPPVRLYSSTATSITVVWDFPRENGGATVMGFELWMDEWAGGYPRMVFDGTDQPEITSFAVSVSSSLGVVSGKSYLFFVRAINYCMSTRPEVACYGDFSENSVFAIRAPRVPLPPPMPYRSSISNVGTQLPGDASITIRWNSPIDNGGASIAGYSIFYSGPTDASYTQIYKPAAALQIDTATIDSLGNSLIMQYTQTGLKEGNVYRFYVSAVNSKGQSAPSPTVSIVAAMNAGVDCTRVNTYSTVAPVITAVDSSQISIGWPMPSSNSTGGTAGTGYKVRHS